MTLQSCYSQLEMIVQDYSQKDRKVKHGLFAGQLSRALREINGKLRFIKLHECSMKQGLKNIIQIAQSMGNQHPILKAAQKCYARNWSKRYTAKKQQNGMARNCWRHFLGLKNQATVSLIKAHIETTV